LKAIEEFSELGSGFQLAMRDLEIRGAGNILGREQHGHINAVGYDLYCKLIETTVRVLKGEEVEEEPEVTLDLDIDTFFPSDFPLDENDKIHLYRRLIRTTNEESLAQLKADLEDRFGPLPRTVSNLVEAQRLKLLASRKGIYRISLEENGISLRFRSFSLKRVEQILGPYSNMVAGMLDDGIILRISGRTESPEKKVELLKKVLSGNGLPGADKPATARRV
jgi:transcription-repair coupling factor (superfamily II helicase)